MRGVKPNVVYTFPIAVAIIFALTIIGTTSAQSRLGMAKKTVEEPGGLQDRVSRNAQELNLTDDQESLGLCQGDCDRDRDCVDDLECFQRAEGKNDTIPGCMGVGVPGKDVPGKDYCYDPNTPMPSFAPSSAPSPQEPTASPQPSFSPTTSTKPSVSPSAAPTRMYLIVLNDTQNLLNKCEGECSDDNDCMGNLACQRRNGGEFVPGCEGTAELGANYCYDKSDGMAPPALPSGGFRLKLYWERGYYWQETYSEKKWCLNDNRPPEIISCGSSAKFEFVYLAGPGDQIKVQGEDMCLDRTGGQFVTFTSCDPNNLDQRWRGNWAARRFDIRPVLYDGCLTNHHHPKSGEIVRVDSCHTAHYTETGFWNLY